MKNHSLIGARFGRLEVVAKHPIRDKHGRVLWNCLCDCGNTSYGVFPDNLISGRTQSCGCLQRERASEIHTTHGERKNERKSPELAAYWHAKKRCNNPNSKDYKNYGGRGIEFHFTSFEEFLSCVGRRPSANHSLDRIDNNGHYEAGNVRWATDKEQYCNRRVRTIEDFTTEELQAELQRRLESPSA